MAQNYFEDVDPAQGAAPERSVRNIPISTNRTAPPRRPSFPGVAHTPRSGRTGKKMALGGVAVLVLIAAALTGLSLLRGTSVVVTPRTHTVVFDETATYLAAREGSSQEGALLSYTFLEKTYEESTSVAASGAEKIEEYARGEIIIYNNHESTPLRLIKNTRFETPEGRVFRIRTSVTVPGKTASGPGSLRATVYADQPGAEYNIGPVEKFTLPGLKTSAPEMFPNVYASSKDAMTQGYKGERPVVKAADLQNTYRELRAKAEQAITADTSVPPAETITLSQLRSVRYEELPPEKRTDGTVAVGLRAISATPSFTASSFAAAVVQKTLAESPKGTVRVKDPTSYSIVARVASSTDQVAFGISGTATLVWDIDATALAKALVGAKEEAFQGIIASFGGVENAQAFLRPFWRKAFPEDPKKIEVIIQTPTSLTQ